MSINIRWSNTLHWLQKLQETNLKPLSRYQDQSISVKGHCTHKTTPYTESQE